MKSAWIAAVSVIAFLALIGSIYIFSPSPSQVSDLQLDVDSLSALTDGQISFNVTLQDAESAVLESVVLNNTRYSWSDGSQDDPTILGGETKHWSINIGTLQNGSNLQIIVETQAQSTTSNVTITPSPSEPDQPDDSGCDEPSQDDLEYVYDNYGGVGLFPEGIHVVATSQNPKTMSGDYTNVNEYWEMLLDHETTQASDQDYISIILSRGDKPTGGYTINIVSFGWLESYPIKLRFSINVTDPGEDVMVTEALTNPLVLVPIGKLTPGEYDIEVYVTQFILHFDEEGNPYYTPIMTFAPVIWKQTLVITGKDATAPSTSFKVNLNGNDAQNLTLKLDLSDGVTETEAKRIAEAAFIQTMGETVLHELDTLTFDNEQITAHYTWGYNTDDMGHVFDLTADIDALQIVITHCR